MESAASVAKNGEQPLLELGRNLRLAESRGSVDGAPVGVHERDAGGTPFDVPLKQLPGSFRQGAVEVVAEQISDLPALDGARLGRVRHGHHYR